MSDAGKGALYGSVIPGAGTALGAGIGSLFGGGGGSAPAWTNPNVTPGTFDEKYMKYLNTLSPEDVQSRLSAKDPTIRGTAIDYANLQAIKSGLGRDPTAQEYQMLAPLGSGAGAQAAQMKYAQDNSPANLAAQQQQAGLDAYNGGKEGFDATTNQAFQAATGRQATADELSHFGGLLASKQIDPYGLSQLIGQTQEAQQAQTQKYQNQLSQNLQGTQGDYFKNYINPTILSQTAAAGRDPNSSGVQQAQVQAGKQQNYDLQNYLAQFGAGQYGQSAQNQQNVYSQYLGQQYGLQNAGISQQLGQQNYIQQRNTDLQNYNMQQQAYQNYLNNYGNRGSGLGGALTGGLSGAATGFKIGGPWGALLGAGVGGAGGYASSGGRGFQL